MPYTTPLGHIHLAKRDNDGKSDKHPDHRHSSSTVNTGLIVGIVLAVTLLLAAGGIFWFRRRSVAKRLKKRQWAKQQKDASFLIIDPKEGLPFPATSSSNMLQAYSSRDHVVPVKMMITGPDGVAQPINNGLLYIPPPAPSHPSPTGSVYGAHTVRNAPANKPPHDASAHVSSPQVTPSPISSPLPPKQLEIAKVHSTFIPALPDELTINVGEMVRIHTEYDDGWGLCSNARDEMGMVPLECLNRASQLPQERPANRGFRKSVRISSLSANPKSPYSANTIRLPNGGNQQ